MSHFYARVEAALLSTSPDDKCSMTMALADDVDGGLLAIEKDAEYRILDISLAGHPPKPILVSPQLVKPRKISTPDGYGAMLHSIAHIEFNAINLALDAVYRFRHLPKQYALDWLRVAKEEAEHFLLMRSRLHAYGFDYGDFEAHNHLWEMAYLTAFDPLLRMALVPRVLEARGLDVTPGIREKIAQRGDVETCAVLDIIYKEEVGHVWVGNTWYEYLCEQRNIDSVWLFQELICRYDLFLFRGYFNEEARIRAGFSQFELDLLHHFSDSMKDNKIESWRSALSRLPRIGQNNAVKE